MNLGRLLQRKTKKSKTDRNKGSSNVVVCTNSFIDYQQERIQSLGRKARKIIISIGGRECRGESNVIPDGVTEKLPDQGAGDWTNYTKAIGSMVHASTISQEEEELVLVHGRLDAFMDFGPWADLKMSCFSLASAYIHFCPNICQ